MSTEVQKASFAASTDMPASTLQEAPEHKATAKTVVFAGLASRALLFKRTGETLVVTFDFYNPKKRGFPEVVASELYARSNFSQLIVSTSNNDWFLNKEFEPLMAACSAASKGYREVICLGFSMGGYGAMLLSKRVGATRVICISPQYSIDSSKAPFEDRWREEASRLQFDDDNIRSEISQDTEGLIIFDPLVVNDAKHVDLIIQAAPKWKTLALKRGGHPATGVLTDARAFGSFNREVISVDYSPTRILEIHKRARSGSVSFLGSLAKAAVSRHPGAAKAILAKALECDFDTAHPYALFGAGRLAVDLDLPRGVEMMELALATFHNPPAWWPWVIQKVKKEIADRS